MTARFLICKTIRYIALVCALASIPMACACAGPALPDPAQEPLPSPSQGPFPTPETQQPASPDKEVEAFETAFLEYLPEATIVDWVLSDIDGDGQEDYVAIFNYEEIGQPPTSSSVGVVCADGARVAVNVASDKPADFVFTLEPHFFVEDSTAYFQLQSLKEWRVYEYGVKFERLEMGFNVAVSSKVIEEINHEKVICHWPFRSAPLLLV